MIVLSLALSVLVSPALPREPLALVPPQRPAGDGALVRLESGGLRAWMGDPRDAGLLAALTLLERRLAELPDELGGGEALPPGVLEVLGDLCTRPVALRVFAGQPGGPFPFRGELVVAAPDAGAASVLLERVEGLLAAAGIERALDADGSELPPNAEGLAQFEGPLPVWIGTRGATFALALGAAPASMPADPALRGNAFELDFALGRFLGLVRELGGDAGLDPLIALVGAEAHFAQALGFADGAQVQRVEFAAPGLGLSAARLDPALLAAMPAQASWALASSVSPLDLARWLRRLGAAAGEPEDPFAELEEELGLELERDLLAHLGAGWGAYASDATGGGGLLSFTLLWEVVRRDALAATLERIAAVLDAKGEEGARGYVRITRRELEGAPAWTLGFPGLPMPVQPTFVLESRHLVLALHPAGARAAQGFVRVGGGLASHPRIVPLFAGRPASLGGVFYLDAPALVRDGYGVVLGLGQMLENGLRSPRDPGREVPTVVPTLAELLRGAQPMTGTLHVEDGVLRFESRSDASWLARTAAQMGLLPAMYQGLLGPMLMAAVPVGLARREQHEWLELPTTEPVETDAVGQARWDLMVIEEALYQFAVNHDGNYPDELAALVHEDENGWTYLGGGPGALLDPWGREYGYERPSESGGIPRVFSLGRDGLQGGTGEDADLDNHGQYGDER